MGNREDLRCSREAGQRHPGGCQEARRALIDRAILWARKALEDLGGFLKGLVSRLIGVLFPDLAENLNRYLDRGIDISKKGSDASGDSLKKDVSPSDEGKAPDKWQAEEAPPRRRRAPAGRRRRSSSCEGPSGVHVSSRL